VALCLAVDRARAQDVVQETMLRAWQHPEVANDSERSARSWLFTVARNMIIDEKLGLFADAGHAGSTKRGPSIVPTTCTANTNDTRPTRDRHHSDENRQDGS
jgi:Sigma-70 region 2